MALIEKQKKACSFETDLYKRFEQSGVLTPKAKETYLKKIGDLSPEGKKMVISILDMSIQIVRESAPKKRNADDGNGNK